jgi:hypothetical protein
VERGASPPRLREAPLQLLDSLSASFPLMR